MYLYGQRLTSSNAGVRSTYSDESLFKTVARQNGPLPDYHPQMLLQCLLWGKFVLFCELAL